HPSGYIHCFYKEATIKPDVYGYFVKQLSSYLSSELSLVVFANYLRSNSSYQKYFQLCRDCHGHPQFLKAETLFSYEHGSDFRIADSTHEKLLAEVADDDFVHFEIPGRVRCDFFCEFITKKKIDVRTAEGRAAITGLLQPFMPEVKKFVDGLADFVHCEPKLPSPEKDYLQAPTIEIGVDWTRDKIIDYLQNLRGQNTTADLAFYAYRDMETCDWIPFLKAVVERNPVSLAMAQSMSPDALYELLQKMDGVSIYDGKRLAQPDEVANYHRGDGFEKALLLANVIRQKSPNENIEIAVADNHVVLKCAGEYRFDSSKGLKRQIHISSAGEIIVSG
ncbi:MAG TPA: hypothetical protein VIK28_06270, partial [Sedimentisphaerales bacterium]